MWPTLLRRVLYFDEWLLYFLDLISDLAYENCNEKMTTRRRVSVGILVLGLLGSSLLLSSTKRVLEVGMGRSTLPWPRSSTYSRSSSSLHIISTSVNNNNDNSSERMGDYGTPPQLPNSGAKRKKPVFVLHVGLPKTGTSFLQCSMSDMYLYKQSTWKKDNFVYLGTYGCVEPDAIPPFAQMHDGYVVYNGGAQVRSFFYDPEIDENVTELELNPKFAASVEYLATLNTNIVFIFEPLSQFRPYQIEQLRRLIEPHWEIQVIVTYRRLYEWLPSMYNQLEKTKQHVTEWPLNGTGLGVIYPFTLYLTDFETDMYFENTQGEEINDLSVHVDLMSTIIPKYFAQFLKFQKHPAELVMEAYKRYLTDNVAIVNLHTLPQATRKGVDPLLDMLFCGDLLLSKTPDICRELRRGGFDDTFTVDAGAFNRAIPLDYDMLAMAAYLKGLVPASMARQNVTERIHAYYEDVLKRKTTDLPRKCLTSQTLFELEELSRKTEQRLFPLEDTNASHHEGFIARSASFCHVDTNLALNDTIWIDFFRNLKYNSA